MFWNKYVLALVIPEIWGGPKMKMKICGCWCEKALFFHTNVKPVTKNHTTINKKQKSPGSWQTGTGSNNNNNLSRNIKRIYHFRSISGRSVGTALSQARQKRAETGQRRRTSISTKVDIIDEIKPNERVHRTEDSTVPEGRMLQHRLHCRRRTVILQRDRRCHNCDHNRTRNNQRN